MELPLCPCGSNKAYEDCCFKKRDANGEPLFYKGAMFGDSRGNWHPIPNKRFAAIIVGQSIDKYRTYAKDLVIKSKLPGALHTDFINHYGIFYQSYEQLLNSLTASHGKGVSFQMDTVEARKNWRDFLLNGRILLDFLGLQCKKTLGLNQDIGGLNKRKFDSLLATLKKQGSKDKHFLEIKSKLELLKEDAVRFIAFRDREKVAGDTIQEFPSTDDEFGIVKGGVIRLDACNYDMIEFIKGSYEVIFKITLILLAI